MGLIHHVFISAVCDIRCLNGGSCVVDGDAQSCMCPANYVGKYCEDYRKFSIYIRNVKSKNALCQAG